MKIAGSGVLGISGIVIGSVIYPLFRIVMLIPDLFTSHLQIACDIGLARGIITLTWDVAFIFYFPFKWVNTIFRHYKDGSTNNTLSILWQCAIEVHKAHKTEITNWAETQKEKIKAANAPLPGRTLDGKQYNVPGLFPESTYLQASKAIAHAGLHSDFKPLCTEEEYKQEQRTDAHRKRGAVDVITI